MAANSTGITDSPLGQPGFEYLQHLWGDSIHGSKAQLQSIGIGTGMLFPGEPDGPKRSLKAIDPHGFQVFVTLATYKGEGIYSAIIDFPGREQPNDDELVNFAPGVQFRRSPRTDTYVGTATALNAAGLVRPDQLPWQPGMRKVLVTILPDGTLPKGAPTANCAEARKPGAKKISRASKTTFSVTVGISEEEQTRRSGESKRKQAAWELKMQALPRPAPLIALSTPPTNIEINYSQLDFMLSCLASAIEMFGMDEPSKARIHTALDELQNAIAESIVIHVPPVLRRDGNVIYL
jgi:hypothetical protein